MLSRRKFIESASGLGVSSSMFGQLSATEGFPPDNTVPGLVNVRSHGAVGDGKTDDTAALKRAIAAAKAAGGGIVLLPVGTYLISSQIVVPMLVRVVGLGSRSSVIKASQDFPTHTALVRLGDGSEWTFSCGLEQLMIECSHILGAIGVYSTDLQENGYLNGVVINSYVKYGILLDNEGGKGHNNWYMENLELGASSAAVDGVGIMIRNSSWKNRIQNVSIVPHAQTRPLQAAGIQVYNGRLHAHGVHVEYHRDAVVFDKDSHGTVSDVDGENCDNIVRLKTYGRVFVMFAFRSLGDSLIQNDIQNHTIRDGVIGFYTQDGGADSRVLTSSPSLPPNDPSAVVLRPLAGKVDWAPPRVLSGRTATITLPLDGITPGDPVVVSFSHSLPVGVLLIGAVSAPGEVGVTLLNQTGKPVSLNPGVVRVTGWPGR